MAALIVVLACAVALLSARLLHQRRLLVAAKVETRRMLDIVKQRVERPNVFSHEVRTPLALIQGAAELLADEAPGPLNDRQREFVTTIITNTRRINDLAQDLLTEAKLDAELFELRVEPVDMRQLARKTVRDARRVQPTPVRLDSTGPPVMLLGDPNLLGQALWNLVSNACRHAAPGTQVTVSVAQGEGQAIVGVSDGGEGMSDAERERLFEPFASSAGDSGTGLGMTITQKIISQHGGRLLVDTVPGRGTTIYFTVPLLPETSEPATSEPTKGAPA